jgi:hypothetical protein
LQRRLGPRPDPAKPGQAARALRTGCPSAISPMAGSPRRPISNGPMAKASRSTARRPNPSMAAIPASREPAMARACSPGEAGWPARRASCSTSIERSANAFMPDGATGT